MITCCHRRCGNVSSLRRSLLLICAILPWVSFAMQPVHNFSDKTVAELLILLEDNDSIVRYCAEIFIGDRYRNPNAVVINGPIHKPNSLAPEFPIPCKVIPALTEHLKSDADWAVRARAIHALYELRFQTNTTPLIALALDDKDPLIRVRACTALVDISHEYKEPLHSKVIPTLNVCLNPEGRVEEIWQAAYAAEALEKDGAPLIPALQLLAKSDSEKVRHYASRALARIQKGKNTR